VAPPPAPARRPVRVLVAEDHPVNRQLIGDQLDKLGYTADFADTGLQALRRFDRERHDVVLTDLSMPGLDGYGLARRLRAQGAAVPIIAITAHTTEEAHRRCAEAGIDAVLTKPFSLAALDAAIAERVPAGGAAIGDQPGPAAGAGGDPSARPLPASFHSAMKQACAQSLARIRAALEAGEDGRALAELHSMKGALLVAQMADAANRCASLEALVRDGERDAVPDALGELERATAQALGQQS
jgi:two-component system capsular synthesis sensor histidine kinase RcsC